MINQLDWINILSERQFDLVLSFLQFIGIFVAALLAAKFAVRQLRTQFKHKITNEGWENLQANLFLYQKSLTTFYSKIDGLNYFFRTQNNPLLNKGDIKNYRFEKWNEIVDSFEEVLNSYSSFLIAFETHEVIFLELKKMNELYSNKIEIFTEEFMKIVDKIFPEMYGSTTNLEINQINEELEIMINKISELQDYIEDFRIELQNVTIGRILGKKVNKRKPIPGTFVLTRYGFMKQGKDLKELIVRK